jgi:creatinine amidohydrolase
MTAFRTHRLGEMTWTEARDAAELNPIVLIPSGAIEQHGPHLPLNEDSITAEWVAERIAEQADGNVLVAPTASYGHSPMFLGYPGTLNLQFNTLRLVMRDIMESLIRHGFRRIVVINNNGGNQAPIAQASWEVRREHDVLVGTVYPWSIGYRVMRDQYSDPDRQYGHGSEPEHSAMLAMFPELVQSQLIEDGALGVFEGWQPTSYNEAAIPGHAEKGTLYWDFSDVSENGVTGNPRLADKALGQIWVERVVGVCVDFVNEYDRNTMNASWAQRRDQ